jgi:hypothetical protein
LARFIDIEWDGPLDIEWEPEIDRLRQSIRSFAPIASGALRSAFLEPRTIRKDPNKSEIIIHVAPPSTAWRYALIQDQGGYVPPYQCPPRPSKKPSWVMVAQIGGQTRFFTKRKGFYLRGFNYIDRGVDDWWYNRNGIEIRWRSGPAGQGLRTIQGGRLSA